MRGPAEELQETVSDGVWIRLAPGHGRVSGRLSHLLRQGAEQGVFTVEDPDFTANYLYTQTLGAMHLARARTGVRAGAGGVPEPFAIEPDQVQEACIADVLASVGARRPVARCRPEPSARFDHAHPEPSAPITRSRPGPTSRGVPRVQSG